MHYYLFIIQQFIQVLFNSFPIQMEDLEFLSRHIKIQFQMKIQSCLQLQGNWEYTEEYISIHVTIYLDLLLQSYKRNSNFVHENQDIILAAK